MTFMEVINGTVPLKLNECSTLYDITTTDSMHVWILCAQGWSQLTVHCT